MKEAFENLQNADVEPREKLKVTKADIVVALPLGEPYFNIHYREVGNDYDNIGFGSYDLNNVIRWREEEMEIVSEVEAEYGNGWIPCSERLPDIGQRVLLWVYGQVHIGERMGHKLFEKYDVFDLKNGTFESTKRIEAWKPLPSPYKPTND